MFALKARDPHRYATHTTAATVTTTSTTAGAPADQEAMHARILRSVAEISERIRASPAPTRPDGASGHPGAEATDRDAMPVSASPRHRPYLDIDGVLLRGAGESIWNGEWEVAPYAAAFLEWALENCQPVWLTARDIDGSGNGIAAAFARAKGGCAALSQLAMRIPSLQWTGLKTEAINYEANFLWLDDCPRPEDLLALERNGCVDRWIEVNTDVQPDALLRVIEIIRLKAGTHDASFQRNGRP